MKNFIDIEELNFLRLSENYKFKSFNCGDNQLNDFLLNDSKKYLKHLRYTTFIFENKEKIVAYYSLANDVLKITDIEDFKNEISNSIDHIDSKFGEEFLSQTTYPAVKIGRLGIDMEFQRRGIGSMIIKALTHSFLNNNKTGCQFITVDALNKPEVMKFYEKNGFSYLTLLDVNKESRLMYKSLLEFI